MDGLIFHETPRSKFPSMVVAFAGWPDAAESATKAVTYLVEKLQARKFAEIDPEEFYDFTQVRPWVLLTDKDEREIRWPGNDFYYYAPEDKSQALIFFIGTEPNLRWRAFSGILLRVAQQCGVTLAVSLGALLDDVPHTREPPITGRASPAELSRKVEWLGDTEFRLQMANGYTYRVHGRMREEWPGACQYMGPQSALSDNRDEPQG